jgi:hypothetical protein
MGSVSDASLRRFRIEQSKLTQYLLNPAHPKGGPKARFFLKVGFSDASPQVLADTLLEHARPERLVGTDMTRWGERLIYEGPAWTPKRGEIRIRSIWQINPDNPLDVVFLTAFPLRG